MLRSVSFPFSRKSLHNRSPLPAGSNRCKRLICTSGDARHATQYVHSMPAICCLIASPFATPSANGDVVAAPSASIFRLPVPFLNVNVSDTLRSASPTFCTVHTNTAHGSELSRYSCGTTGDICRPIRRTPCSDRSISVQARGYSAVYVHRSPSSSDCHAESGLRGRLQWLNHPDEDLSESVAKGVPLLVGLGGRVEEQGRDGRSRRILLVRA